MVYNRYCCHNIIDNSCHVFLLQDSIQPRVSMKGIVELNWKLILIIVLALFAFLTMYLILTGVFGEITQQILEFDLKDLIDFVKGKK